MYNKYYMYYIIYIYIYILECTKLYKKIFKRNKTTYKETNNNDARRSPSHTRWLLPIGKGNKPKIC